MLSPFAKAGSYFTFIPNGVFGIGVSGNNLQLTYTAAIAAAPLNAYWKGDVNATWNTLIAGNTNWATTDTNAVPGAASNVFFTANSATNFANTLGANFSINSVTFTGAGTSAATNSIMIGGANTLTIGAGGVSVLAGSAAHTISSAVALGSLQTWTNNSGSLLTVSGNISNGANNLTVGGTGNTTLSGILGGGAGGLIKNDAGTLTLNGGNTYTGATNVNGGTLAINQVGPGSNNADIGAGANTQFASSALNTVAGATTIFNTGSNFSSSNTGTTIAGGGTLRLQSGVWWLGNAGGGTAISMSSGGLIEIMSGATLKNDYASANWSANQANMTVNAGGTLNLRNNNVFVNSLNGGGAIFNDFATNTLTVGVAGGSGTFTGLITANAGVLNLTKSGTGTQVLSGNNTYTGTTTLTTTVASTANELIVNGTTSGQGNYIINSGGRLGGDGTIGLVSGGNVFISGTPGDLSPGDKGSMPSVTMPSGSRVASYSYSAGQDAQTVGTLTILGDVDMDGYLIIDLVSPSSHDILNVSEDFIIDAGADLEINGETDFTQLDFFGDLGFVNGNRVDLVNAGNILGNFGNVAANQQFFDAAGNLIFYGNDGSTIFLQAVPVPEPASLAIWSLIGFVALAGGWRMKHRRRQ